MPVDVAFPEPDDDEPEDEFLTNDDAVVEDVTPLQKTNGGRIADPVESAKLSAQMWEEYAGGMPMKEIGDLHGMTRVSVWNRLRKLRQKMGIEDLNEAKALDLGRYEALIERVWSRAFKDPTPENVRTLAMLMDQRAKLLGLNAPKRLSVDGQMNVTPSPALTMLLERVQAERNRLTPEIRQIEGDVVDAELVEDD